MDTGALGVFVGAFSASTDDCKDTLVNMSKFFTILRLEP